MRSVRMTSMGNRGSLAWWHNGFPTMQQLHYTEEVLYAWSHKSYLRNLNEAYKMICKY